MRFCKPQRPNGGGHKQNGETFFMSTVNLVTKGYVTLKRL